METLPNYQYFSRVIALKNNERSFGLLLIFLVGTSSIGTMKILVCIKESINPGEMNRFDTFALELALALKESHLSLCKISIDVATLGSKSGSQIIRRAYGMGADNGIHIVDNTTDFITPFETASALAPITEKRAYDLILTGMMSEDMMAGQTGPMLAEILGLNCVTGVVKASLCHTDRETPWMAVEQELENGARERLEIRIPCALAVHVDINTPRYPSLSNTLAAAKKKIHTFKKIDVLQDNFMPREYFVSLDKPEKTRAGKFLKGTLTEKADQFRLFLKQRALI